MPAEFEFSGADSEFAYLTEQLDVLASRKFMNMFVEEVSKEALRLVKEQFETETDPFGKKWAPRSGRYAKRMVGHKILTGASGNLKKSIKRVLTHDGFKLVSNSPYIHFIQGGTRTPRPGRANAKRSKKGRWTKRTEHTPARMIFPPQNGTIADSRATVAGEALFRLISTAVEKVSRRLDLDMFTEGGGVAVFERSRNSSRD